MSQQPMITPTPPLSVTLRQLREAAGISGNEAARLAGLTQSKVSRAETGRFAPTPDEVKALCEVYRAPAALRRDLMRMAREVREASHSARVTLQRGGWRMQHRIAAIEASAARIVDFAPAVMVGLVQTEAYADALLGQAVTGEDRTRLVQTRLERQAILGSPERDITIVMTEGAVRWCMGSPAVMVQQLDHVVDISHRANVHIGIIPWNAPATVPVLHGFALYDSRAVLVGTINATAIITDPTNVRDYEEHWKEIEPLVSWNDAARAELQRARDDYRRIG